MTKDEIKNILLEHLAPVFEARVELVEKLDQSFYFSSNGEAELLNMALISSYFKTLSSENTIKHIHDENFSSYSFYTNTKQLLGLKKDDIKNAGWHTDFRSQKLNKWVHLFAQDAGVDDFYNAIEKCPRDKAPIDRFGEILSWDEMRHSQILSEPLDTWPVQKIKPQDINAFCLQKEKSEQKSSASYNTVAAVSLNMQKSY